LLARLVDRGAGVAGDATRGLLSAVWSFPRNPTVLEDRVVDVQERLAAVERRIVGDLKAAIENRIDAAEGASPRLSIASRRTSSGPSGAPRVAGLDARLQALRTRVVEDLKTELRKVILLLALGTGGDTFLGA
jgi:hypothetical protein